MNDAPKMINLPQQTPGQIIKAVRESKNISLHEAAQRLLLSKQIVTAIEEDDYSKIVAKVYAEGYLKAYAKFLQIPVDDVLMSFRRMNFYSGAKTKGEVENNLSTDSLCCLNFDFKELLQSERVRFIAVGVVVFLVLAVLALFIIRSSFNNKVTEVTRMPQVASDNTADMNIGKAPEEQVPMVVTTVGGDILAPERGKKAKNNRKEKVLPAQTTSGALMLDSALEEPAVIEQPDIVPKEVIPVDAKKRKTKQVIFESKTKEESIGV